MRDFRHFTHSWFVFSGFLSVSFRSSCPQWWRKPSSRKTRNSRWSARPGWEQEKAKKNKKSYWRCSSLYDSCVLVFCSKAWSVKFLAGREWTWTFCSSTLKYDEHNFSATHWMRSAQKNATDICIYLSFFPSKAILVFPSLLLLFSVLSTSMFYCHQTTPIKKCHNCVL